VYAAVGVHPHRADQFEAEADRVKALLSQAKVVAVGEIGLDYYRDYVRQDLQVAAFRTQLGWARSHGLAACIHMRAADTEVIGAVREEGGSVVLHCFSSDAAVASEALALGCTLSFAGNITFPNAEQLRAVATNVPGDRLLFETDSPLLAPQPWRGRRNEPAYLVAIAEALASLRGCSVPELAAKVAINADRLFHWGAT
jgi:TatD DNase family protein